VAKSSTEAKVRQMQEAKCRNCYRMSIGVDQGFREECQRKIGPFQLKIRINFHIQPGLLIEKKITDGGESELMSPETPVLELLLSLVGDVAF
jgi:hypothetical protein